MTPVISCNDSESFFSNLDCEDPSAATKIKEQLSLLHADNDTFVGCEAFGSVVVFKTLTAELGNDLVEKAKRILTYCLLPTHNLWLEGCGILTEEDVCKLLSPLGVVRDVQFYPASRTRPGRACKVLLRSASAPDEIPESIPFVFAVSNLSLKGMLTVAKAKTPIAPRPPPRAARARHRGRVLAKACSATALAPARGGKFTFVSCVIDGKLSEVFLHPSECSALGGRLPLEGDCFLVDVALDPRSGKTKALHARPSPPPDVAPVVEQKAVPPPPECKKHTEAKGLSVVVQDWKKRNFTFVVPDGYEPLFLHKNDCIADFSPTAGDTILVDVVFNSEMKRFRATKARPAAAVGGVVASAGAPTPAASPRGRSRSRSPAHDPAPDASGGQGL